jgi:hypothetical protein
MEEQFFDDLAKGLSGGSLSRGQALKLVGAALLSSALMPFFPRQALAITRKKCKKHGNVYLSKGTCHCGLTCTSTSTPRCGSHSYCTCFATAEGPGFCAGLMTSSYGCSATSECTTTGYKCVVEYGCSSPGQSCTTGADCHRINPDLGCISGTCQSTFCASPCPP